MVQIIEKFDEISHRYKAVFCDLWGCVHNGIAPFPDALLALQRYKENGGIVHFLTNSPRPSHSIYKQLDHIGIPRNLYSGITASGDAAQAEIIAGLYGKNLYHIGPEKDHVLFENIKKNNPSINLVELNQADSVICTGLFDDSRETPDDYKITLLSAKNRGLRMLCANPDIFVDRGAQRIYCAGAIAQAYNHIGGKTYHVGKPYPPIYNLAYKHLNEQRGDNISRDDILCIGDGINTDIKGAIGENLDCLFITGGLSKEETKTNYQPDSNHLEIFLKNAQLTPSYIMGHLR